MAKPKGTPKVVLLGKQTNSKDADSSIKNILSEIGPSDIPCEFLHTIVINTEDGNKYKISDSKQDISYAHIEKYIATLGLKEPIESIEIVVDLDKIKRHLEEESNSVLKQIFE